MQCSSCAHLTHWDPDANSNVCPACGVLSDPSQLSLDSSSLPSLSSLYENEPLTSSHTGWHLPGQHSETRDRRNKLSSKQFIRDLARHMHAPGEAERANSLFIQAMQRGNFKWGRKSKLISTACLAIALRESNRPCTFREIALIIQEPPVDVSRAFTQLLSLFELNFDPLDPSIYLSALYTHLEALITGPVPAVLPLPIGIIKDLKRISLQSALHTAQDLIDILVRHERQHVLSLEPQSTAAAAFILSLEAEMRQPFSNLARVASYYTERSRINKGVILSRYKAIQDYLHGCTHKIEWLDSPKEKGGSFKRRLFVARGLKDIIQFQNKLWKKDLDQNGRPTLHFIDGDDSLTPQLSRLKRARSMSLSADMMMGDTAGKRPRRSLKPRSHLVSSFFLANSGSSAKMPSRLQLLSHTRGGSDAVSDDELFAEGEWEGLLRTESEMQTLARQVDWPDPVAVPHAKSSKHLPPLKDFDTSSPGSDLLNLLSFPSLSFPDVNDAEASLIPPTQPLPEADDNWRDSLASHLAKTFSFDESQSEGFEDFEDEGFI